MSAYIKSVHPHLHEWSRLGGDDTPEGRDYIAKNQRICNEEFVMFIRTHQRRNRMGGTKHIHNIDEHHEQRYNNGIHQSDDGNSLLDH